MCASFALMALPCSTPQGASKWVNATDLKFCTTRNCGLKVELGASCNPPAVSCCDIAEEGGDPMAECLDPPYVPVPGTCGVKTGGHLFFCIVVARLMACEMFAVPLHGIGWSTGAQKTIDCKVWL